MISANAVPRMITVPTRLPKIISRRRQNGYAAAAPTIGGAISSSAIHRQFNSVTPFPPYETLRSVMQMSHRARRFCDAMYSTCASRLHSSARRDGRSRRVCHGHIALFDDIDDEQDHAV